LAGSPPSKKVFFSFYLPAEASAQAGSRTADNFKFFFGGILKKYEILIF